MAKTSRKTRRKPFEASSIVAQAFPPNPLVGKTKLSKTRMLADGTLYSYARTTSDNKGYSAEADKIRGQLFHFSKKRTATVMAFCKNYFIKHQKLLSMEKLQKVFPFLK